MQATINQFISFGITVPEQSSSKLKQTVILNRERQKTFLTELIRVSFFSKIGKSAHPHTV